MNFLRAVDQAKIVGNLTDVKTASLVAAKLTGLAKQWFNRLVMRNDPRLNDWREFKALITQRYMKKLNMGEIQQLYATLTQQSGENVSDFRDRVEVACLTEDLSLEAGIKAEAGYENALNRKIRRLFIAGLSERIRSTMASIDVEAADIEQLMIAAERAENLQKTTSIVHGPGGALVAAAQYGGGRGRGGFRGGGFRGAARGGGRGGGPRDMTKVRCFRCNNMGHMRADCKVPADKIKKFDKFEKGGFRPRGTAAVDHEQEDHGERSWAEEAEEDRLTSRQSEYQNPDDLN
jgi:hypothetical protein